jgi:hypothetical protein
MTHTPTTYLSPHSQLDGALHANTHTSAPHPLSFCARCQKDISQAPATVRIEGKVYCTDCELAQEEMSEGLDVLFNEVREADRMPGYTVPAWNEG